MSCNYYYYIIFALPSLARNHHHWSLPTPQQLLKPSQGLSEPRNPKYIQSGKFLTTPGFEPGTPHASRECYQLPWNGLWLKILDCAVDDELTIKTVESSWICVLESSDSYLKKINTIFLLDKINNTNTGSLSICKWKVKQTTFRFI